MIKYFKYFLASILILTGFNAYSQDVDSAVIRNLYSEALTSNISYENLRELCKNIGGRLTGSKHANDAIKFIEGKLKGMNLDNVYLQELKVRNWERGEKEVANAMTKKGRVNFNVCALGISVGTGDKGLTGKVIEVKSWEELKNLGKENIEGRIVFFSRAADQKGYTTGYGYGSSVDQRVKGAVESARYGAIGVIVRSATVAYDGYPHTGVMRYNDSLTKIPAIGISTKESDILSGLLKEDKDLEFYFRTTCHQDADVKSFNVIGEIKGSEFPEEVIVVGGHVDSWDLGEGAHDDGTGIVQSMEVLRLFQSIGIKPKHTIRFVGFMDEEIDQKGGRKYADAVKNKNEKHLAAIESDGGGFTPHGFSFEASDAQIEKLKSFQKYLEPYWMHLFVKGGSGVDVGFLKESGAALIGLIVDSQRYFDYHHSANDVFENVNRREMQLGSASMAALIYLIDKYGI
ncbi:MAG: M20/M25/M40 family metallo-hydrolase [Ignavibacteriae bacterium]|nr:M20/M25/M40 family metallo-hydrolase [Ignavibacteriota bacterium]